MGQPYACLSSPTHPHPPEKQVFPVPAEADHDQDPNVRQGLRSWRINSYLSAYGDTGEEGLPQPLGPDAFQDPESDGKLYAHEAREPPNVPSKPRPDIRPLHYSKPFMPESMGKDRADRWTTEWEREREKERVVGGREVGADVEMPSSREAPGEVSISKHETVRMRVNPMLQRSSRLRSSLIFSSSKTETHMGGLGMKVFITFHIISDCFYIVLQPCFEMCHTNKV